MITSISWVPKGASKSVPSVADPPSKEQLEELKKTTLLEKRYFFNGFNLFYCFGLNWEKKISFVLIFSYFEYLSCWCLFLFDGCSIDVESEEEYEDMNVDVSELDPAEIEQALGAANAFGKGLTRKAGGFNFNDVDDGLDELNMDDYDDEDDGISFVNTFFFILTRFFEYDYFDSLLPKHSKLISVTWCAFNIFNLLISAIDIFGSGLGDTFYPSNELDPYINDVSSLIS